MKHTLLLLRHGKSDYPPAVGDHERPLAPRGQRQARQAGKWISERVSDLDLILCSTAVRTRQTLKETGLEGMVVYLDDLYDESHLTYLEVIRKHSSGAKSVLVVGHEPSISATALSLAKNRSSEAARQIERKYPTSGVALLHSSKDLSQAQSGHLELTEFFVP